MLSTSNTQYDTFLRFVDKAIAGLEPEETDPAGPAGEPISCWLWLEIIRALFRSCESSYQSL